MRAVAVCLLGCKTHIAPSEVVFFGILFAIQPLRVRFFGLHFFTLDTAPHSWTTLVVSACATFSVRFV